MSKLVGGGHEWILWGSSNALRIIAGIFSPQAAKALWSSAATSIWATSLHYLGGDLFIPRTYLRSCVE